jgi:hypothetical protein
MLINKYATRDGTEWRLEEPSLRKSRRPAHKLNRTPTRRKTPFSETDELTIRH